MKYRLLIFFLAVFLLSSCSPRSSGNSHPEPDASISSSEAEAPSKEEEKPASQESAASEETSAVEEAPPQEEYPVPLLTETEKNMLSESLALFAQYIGPNNIGDPSALPKDLILNASLAEIERTKEINAYFQKIWNNEYGDYTVAFETYQQNSIIKKVLYYIQETTGLCTY